MSSGEKFFSFVITATIIISSLFGYYTNIAAIKGDGAVSSLTDALAYVEAHWQPGDVMYMTDDGPWVNVRPYTDKPMYRMPECEAKGSYAPVLGALSPATRAALGMVIANLSDVVHTRAWIFAPHLRCIPNVITTRSP